MQAYSLGQGNAAFGRKYCSARVQSSRSGVSRRGAFRVQAFTTQTEAPARASGSTPLELQPSQAELLQGLKGPLVRITAHYHVNFGDILKVIGGSEDFGAWDAAAAPKMDWGDGDVWSLLMPLSPGEHEFKVVVQMANGELLWEGGINRKVIVPEEAPFGTMLVADCAFNYAEIMPEPELQPVSEDVIQLLEAKAEAELAAAIEVTSREMEKQQVSDAAAAVAKALATLDAEAEETGRRSLVSIDAEDQFRSVTTVDSVELDVEEPAAAQSDRASEQIAREVDITTTAAAELEQQMEQMAFEAHALDSSALEAASTTPAASVHAKLALDKPVAVGFIKTTPQPKASTDAKETPAAEAAGGDPSDVVAAFMKSVTKKAPAIPTAAPTETPAETPAEAEDLPADDASTQEPAADILPAEETPMGAAAAVAEVIAATESSPTTSVDAPALEDISIPESAAVEDAVEDAAAIDTAQTIQEDLAIAAQVVDAEPTDSNSNNSTPDSDFSSRGMSTAAPVTPSSSPGGSRSPSPGRASSRAAAATAAAAKTWMEGVKSNGVMAAAREAEEAAKAKAERLATAQKAASAAAAESEKLNHDLHSNRPAPVVSNSNNGRFRLGSGYGGPATGNNHGGSGSGMAMAMPAPPEVLPTSQDQVYKMSSAAAAPGLSPPPVSAPPSPRKARSSHVAALSADTLPSDADEADGDWNAGMQMVAAVVGCAAVGTVMWSEFVLKDTGCGLPPGPYGLLGAAEGLSYLAVLGFAGTGLAARGTSGGKRGLPGALAVPEVLAYGALAAGLLVLASQLNEYGYIPPPLPGGQCYSDAAVAALPAADDLSAELAAQLAALQAILSQLKSAAAEGIDSLQLQQQLAQLQAQVDTFSTIVASQASALDAQLQSGLLQLQDSLSNATTAVSSFVDTQMQHLDLPGKLAYVVDVLKKQEQQLVVELPKQFAELQKLAATAAGMVQETALQAASTSHLPELLASLDKSMGMLHDVLEVRIQQLDLVLTQLHDSCASAAMQLTTAATAAHEAGLTEASAQLAHLQSLLADSMMRVQAQVWAGYQQLALADHLSDMLLKIRSSAAEVAASTTAQAEKLHLQQQLAELEAIAESSVAALSNNAMDQLSKLELEERLIQIEQQAASAAAALKSGLVQQYNEQLPVLQQQLGSLQDTLSGWAVDAQHGVQQKNVEELLGKLQHSLEATAKAVREVAVSGADSAGHQLQVAGNSLGSNLEQLSGSVSKTISSSNQSVSEAVSSAASAVKTAAAPVQQAVASAPAAVREAVATNPMTFSVRDMGDDLIAYTPDIESVKQLWEADDFLAPGVDLRDANEAVKSIWANRPQ